MPTKLNEGDRALIREIAFEVCDIVLARHVQTCPHARRLDHVHWMFLGIGIGLGLAGAGVGFALARIFM